jgi:hypothetical protein
MIKVFVKALGLVAPGLAGWQNARAVLDGTQEYQPEEIPVLKPPMLLPNERRRTSKTIKLALQAIHDALGDSITANDYSSVFASSEGDMEIVDHICDALNQAGRPVSPTHFHNSVHNAPAGYAGIAGGSHNPSTSLAALQGSFATALLEASVQVVTGNSQVLCVVYDNSVPFPLDEFIPIDRPFAVAILLSRNGADSLAQLTLELTGKLHESRMSETQLESLRIRNPAARSLPLLQQLASAKSARLQFPYLPDLGLNVGVAPC